MAVNVYDHENAPLALAQLLPGVVAEWKDGFEGKPGFEMIPVEQIILDHSTQTLEFLGRLHKDAQVLFGSFIFMTPWEVPAVGISAVGILPESPLRVFTRIESVAPTPESTRIENWKLTTTRETISACLTSLINKYPSHAHVLNLFIANVHLLPENETFLAWPSSIHAVPLPVWHVITAVATGGVHYFSTAPICQNVKASLIKDAIDAISIPSSYFVVKE